MKFFLTTKPKRLTFDRYHNAFCDLFALGAFFLVSFRRANDHMAKRGDIVILKLNRHGDLINKQVLSLPNCDLRDPKLTRDSQGRVYLNAYGRFYAEDGTHLNSQSVIAFSDDGWQFSQLRTYGKPYWWIWKLRWYQGHAYGFAYRRSQQQLALYRGNPLRTFHPISAPAMCQQRDGLGYPNETDLLFNSQQALSVVRRDADSYSAQLGTAVFPFHRWHWRSLSGYIASPAMVAINHYLVVVGRIWYQGRFVTALLTVDPKCGKVKRHLVLPSGGDCGYPGLHLEGNELHIAYYSSHQDNNSHVYLAKIHINY